MKKIAFTVDSSCDLPKGFAEENDIFVISIPVLHGDTLYTNYKDVSPADLIKLTKETGVLPKTSAPTIPDFEDVFEEVLKTHDEIIHFSISSKASCSYQNSCLASEKFDGRVKSIDTLSLSGGIGLLVYKAVEMRKQEKTSQEIVEEILALRNKAKLSFVVDVLDFLHKGGRCSSMQYYGSKILKIHPEIDMVEGQLKSADKFMGSIGKCYLKYVDKLSEKYTDYDDSVCYITYSPTSIELVDAVEMEVKQKFNFKNVFRVDASATITCHCGQNTLGVLFLTK